MKILKIAAGVLAFAASAAAAHATVYTRTELPGFPNQVLGYAIDINNSNQIAGAYGTGGGTGYKASKWDSTGQHLLPYLPNTTAGFGYGINNSGQIGGTSRVSANSSQIPTIWDETGAHELGVVPGSTWARIEAINDSGQCAGTGVSAYMNTAILWEANGDVHDLSQVAGTRQGSYSYDINNSRQVVGLAGGRACIWDSAGYRDLPLLSGYYESRAYAINEQGWAVGSCQNGSSMACIWDDYGVRALGCLPGDTGSAAYGINKFGLVVGGSYTANGTRPVYWDSTGVHALDTADTSGLGLARRVNDNGWIVGDMNGIASVWTPAVPEPSSVLALLSGMIGIGGMALRRRK